MYKGVKRALDVTFSLIGTAVSSPILLAVAAAVKLDSKGPVIFKQERLGKDGKVFEMYKFRSMCVGAEHMGTGQYSYKGDSRVTRVGKIIRATSLDELPQFINILKGDMSFIGPRPELLRYTDAYEGAEKYILKVRPGITDYSSIEFINLDEIVGAENADEYYEKYVLKKKNLLRIKYAATVSLTTDLKLFWFTVWNVIKKALKFIFVRKEKDGVLNA